MPVGLRQPVGVLHRLFTSEFQKSSEQIFEVICGPGLMFLQQICGVSAERLSHR
jgi:hypothetical protein